MTRSRAISSRKTTDTGYPETPRSARSTGIGFDTDPGREYNPLYGVC